MSDIVNFYNGLIKDPAGRYLIDMQCFSKQNLEEVHDYIQWMFPNKEPSRFNPNAPLLTDDDIEVFRRSPNLLQKVSYSLDVMMIFYKIYPGLEYRKPGEIPAWVTPNNHNFMRITRILNCLAAFKMHDQMIEFWTELLLIYNDYSEIIGETTLGFWIEAAEKGVSLNESFCINKIAGA